MNASLRYVTGFALLMLALALNGCGTGVNNPDVTLLDKTKSLTRNRISGTVYEMITLKPGSAGRLAGDTDVQAATQSVVMHAATESVPFDPAAPGESATATQRALQIPQSTTHEIVVPKPDIKIDCGGKSTQTDANGNYVIDGFGTWSDDDGKQKVICELEGQKFKIVLGSLRDPGPFNVESNFELYANSSRALTVASNVSNGNLYINGATTTAGDSFPTIIRIDNEKEYNIQIGAEGYEKSDAYTTAVCKQTNCNDESVTITLRPLVTSIEVSTSSGGSTVNTGETTQLKALCAYNDGTSGDCTGDVQWRSSDSTVATVTATGLFSMLKSGTVNITAIRTQSGITSAPYAITSDVAVESTCDGVTGVCLDLVGASIKPGGNAVVSVVASAAPQGGITAGELKLTWGQGVTLTSATAAGNVKIWSQETDAPRRTFSAVYTSGGVIASGDTIMTLSFAANTTLADSVNVNWVSSSDEHTDLTDALFASWNFGSFVLRGALLSIGK